MSRTMPWLDIHDTGRRLQFYSDNPDKLNGTMTAVYIPEPRADPVVQVLCRVLGALSDEMACRLDPRLQGQQVDDAWNVDIMTDAMRVLKECGVTWYPSQRAVAKKIAEVVLTEVRK